MKLTNTVTVLLVSLILLTVASTSITHATTPTTPNTLAFPNPVLHITGIEYYTANSTNFVRYRYNVFNKDAYSAELFAPAPDLPPCGLNTNSSRTWVDFFDQYGKRLYGFCALGKPEQLGTIWFALPEGTIPPSWIYIEMTDRKTKLKYKSNLAETTL